MSSFEKFYKLCDEYSAFDFKGRWDVYQERYEEIQKELEKMKLGKGRFIH